MPFRSTTKSTRKPTRLKRFLSGAGKTINYGLKAYKIATKIAKLVNVEVKHLDTTVSGGFNSTGIVNSLNTMAQGDTNITRNGDSIKALSIHGKGFLSVGSDDSIVRVMLVLDKQCRGAAPAVTDILESASVTAHQNLDNLRRFKILDDKLFRVETNLEKQPFEIIQTFPNLHLYYSDGDADAAALKDNALFALVISDTDPATDPQVNVVWRLSFTDN